MEPVLVRRKAQIWKVVVCSTKMHLGCFSLFNYEKYKAQIGTQAEKVKSSNIHVGLSMVHFILWISKAFHEWQKGLWPFYSFLGGRARGQCELGQITSYFRMQFWKLYLLIALSCCKLMMFSMLPLIRLYKKCG